VVDPWHSAAGIPNINIYIFGTDRRNNMYQIMYRDKSGTLHPKFKKLETASKIEATNRIIRLAAVTQYSIKELVIVEIHYLEDVMISTEDLIQTIPEENENENIQM
jgi:hypothetical protein